MDEVSGRLSKLGAAVADADSPDAGAIAEAKRRLGRGPRRATRRSVAPIAAVAAAALLALAFVLATRSANRTAAVTTDAPPIDFVVGTARDAGRVGQWIAATETPTPLRFSEGTAITVGSDARARVSELSARGASVDLERGTLAADVTHREASEWGFRAGPYTVRVTGTRFDLSWDAAAEELTLRMHEGSVEVIGPDFEQPVVAGQTLRASHRAGRLELARHRAASAEAAEPIEALGRATSNAPAATEEVETARARTSEATSEARAEPREARDSRSRPHTSAARDARTPGPPAMPDESEGLAPDGEPRWRALLAGGSHAAALAAAEQEGYARVLLSAEPDDLYRLADAARLVGRPERARDALVALRTRHGERGRTAFLLGRISHAAGDRRDAIRWLETYLAESPGGALEESALGRLIELDRDVDPASAHARAERYLARHPTGAYADLARSVLAR